MKRCPKCLGLMPDDVFLCIRCGHDSSKDVLPTINSPVATTAVAEHALSNVQKRNWARICAMVLTSYMFFFFASCTTGMYFGYETAKKLGTRDMDKDQPSNARGAAIVRVPDAKKPGQHVVHQVLFVELERFKKENPDYSFLLPIGQGEVNDIGLEMKTKYVVSAVGLGKVSVETNFFHDVPPAGYEIDAKYEATDKSMELVYVRGGPSGLFALFFGFVFACLFSVTGLILRWRLNKSARPLLVQIALSGVKSRRGASISIGICVVMAVLFALESFVGLILLVPAWGIWYAMRWVDENEGWDSPTV